MESLGFSWIVLSWLFEIFEFFTVLQGELGPTGFKMGKLSFARFLYDIMFLKFRNRS